MPGAYSLDRVQVVADAFDVEQGDGGFAYAGKEEVPVL